MSETPLQGSLAEIIDTVTRILGKAVDLNLPEVDMTIDQKESTALALKECAGIFQAYAGDFRKIARSDRV